MRSADFQRLGPALLGTVLTLLLLSSAAPAQVAVDSLAIQDVLQQGRRFEQERRWGDALTYYEDEIRKHPGQEDLERRYEFARMHFDLCRRYNDHSFLGLTQRLSRVQALDLYSEVMAKVQTYYVDEPNWSELIERGTSNFEIALTEADFRRGCAEQLDDPSAEAFRADLRQMMAREQIATQADARRVVDSAASLAEQRLRIAPASVVLEYLCGATNALDFYSAYLTPGQLSELYSQIEGNFVGLGIELKADSTALNVVRVIAGSPAEQAGLKPGDRITWIDGRSINEIPSDQAANLLQGREGTLVQMHIERDGQPYQLSVQRRRVEVPSIEDVKIVDSRQGIGYLRLTCFQKTTSRDLDNALWSLHRSGMRSLIMDLRGNPGGLLVTAVEVADKFLDRGVIVSTHGRSPQEDFTYSAHEPGTWRVPLVVLIDHDSASAAEIFAGAIRDHRRGTIVGERSYGKGSVQGIFPLSTAEAGVRLTTAKFYSPKGTPFSGIGVAPDMTVHEVARPVSGSDETLIRVGEDMFLATAVQAAQQQMKWTAQR